MTPDDIGRRLRQAKNDSDLIDRIAAAIEGESADQALLALTAMQAEIMLNLGNGDEEATKRLWEAAFRHSAAMLHCMLTQANETIN